MRISNKFPHRDRSVSFTQWADQPFLVDLQCNWYHEFVVNALANGWWPDHENYFGGFSIMDEPCAIESARTAESQDDSARPVPMRIGYAAMGVTGVTLAGIGAVLPVMPTTIFLIFATWCFARSYPALEDKLVRNRFFAPFTQFMSRGKKMSTKTKSTAIVVMWIAIAISSVALFQAEHGIWPVVTILMLGTIGTLCVAYKA